MTIDVTQIENELSITTQFASVPVQDWHNSLEKHAFRILNIGDNLVKVWQSEDLNEAHYDVIRQFLRNCSYYLMNRPELHRPEWLQMGVALASDDQSRGWFLGCLGTLSFHWGEYRQALGYYEDALTIYQVQQDKVRQGKMLSSIGGAWMMLDEHSKGMAYQEQACDLLEQTDDKKSLASALNGLAVHYLSNNLIDKGRELIQKALDISLEIDDLGSIATSMNSMGLVADERTRLDYFEKALDMHRQLGHKPCEAVTYANIASCFVSWKLPAKGIPYAQASLELAQELRNRHYQVVAYNLLGIFERLLGKSKQALAYHEQALSLAREGNLRTEQIHALGLTGQVYKKMLDAPNAISAYEQAKQIAQQIGNPNLEFALNTHLFSFYKDTRDFTTAFDVAQEMIAFADKTENPQLQALAYRVYATILRYMGRDKLDEAIEHSQKAYDIFTSHGLKHDIGGCEIDTYRRHLSRLRARRDGLFFKIFPFLR